MDEKLQRAIDRVEAEIEAAKAQGGTAFLPMKAVHHGNAIMLIAERPSGVGEIVAYPRETFCRN